MSIFTRPILEINLNNVLKNYKTLQKLASKSIAAAVVKDDSYGVGAVEVTKILYEKAKCRHFFVAYAVEGKKIREVAPEANIYVLQGIGEDELPIFKEFKLIPVINSIVSFEFWKKNRIEGIKPAIQVETGLNRLGFREEGLAKLTKEDRAEFSFVMSHLACADNQAHFLNENQLKTFKKLKAKYFPKLPASLSASDGAFLGDEFRMDIVRLGAAMYGINTTSYRENIMESVITLKAPVLQIVDLKAGEYVGYGATYQAKTDRKIAVISIGYGDGLFRSLSNVGSVYFNNSSAKIIGRVSMDNIVCDITDIKGIKVGSYVNLLDENHTLDHMAMDAGTIGYEILSRIGKGQRFKKEYIGNAQ